MIKCTMFLDGTVREDVPLADISEVIPNKANQVWLDLEGEQPEKMALLKEEFGFHDLALEDCVKAGQRAKVDEYTGYFFLVFYAPYWDAKKKRVRARELHCFVGANYMVTVHHEPISALETARQRWTQNIPMMKEGIGHLVYTIMDAMVDEYFPLLDHINGDIETLEERLLRDPREQTVHPVFRLKKDILFLRKMLAPKRDIFNILSRRDQPLFPAQTQFYLRDVYDHILRILEQVDVQREMITSLLEVYLSTVSNRMNAVMKTLTVAATVLMTLGLIAGIYGMNFRHMPELEWVYGYPTAIGLMAVSGTIMAIYFRRRHWF